MANPQYQREDLNPQDPTKQIKVSGEFSERIVEEISPENQILRNHLERASDVMYDKVRRKDFRNKITNEKGNIVGWVKFPREFINEMIDTLNKVDNERHLMRQLEGVTYHSFGLESDLNEVRDIGNMFVGKERKKEIENYIHKQLKKSEGGFDTFSGIEAREKLLKKRKGDKNNERMLNDLNGRKLGLLKQGNNYKPINYNDGYAFVRARFYIFEKIQGFAEKIYVGEKAEIKNDPAYIFVKGSPYLRDVLEEFLNQEKGGNVSG
ncbi:MAG: hypothetical protein OXU73_02895 [Candidatus Campbellbacteria bacterium]|nr:hypothetical protein [Candidatus Campbellbacteria bacterium]